MVETTRIGLAAAAAAIGLLAGSTAQAGTTSNFQYLALGIGDVTMVRPTPVGPGIGGVCRDVPLGAWAVLVSVEDDVVQHVGFRIGFYVPSGRIGDLASGCDFTGVPVPGDATFIRVFIDGALNGPAECGTTLPEGVGVAGTVEIDWAVV